MPFFPSSSSSSSNSNFTLFSPSQNTHTLSKFSFKIPIVPLPSPSSPSYLTTTTTLTSSCSSSQNDVVSKEDSKEKELLVRRPVMTEFVGGEGERNEVEVEVEDDGVSKASGVDVRLTELAKKMPIFEPERVEVQFGSMEKPLVVNMDLALYRAKVLARSFRYQEAQKLLEKVWFFYSLTFLFAYHFCFCHCFFTSQTILYNYVVDFININIKFYVF
jgi:hypothetical protein